MPGPPGDPEPTKTPTGKPTNPPQPPPPPEADGDMTGDELDLFNRIDSARKSKGCAPLEQDAPVTYGARNEADRRSESGEVEAHGASWSAAGGDNWSSDEAFDRMMRESRDTVLNCGLDTLGVGRETQRYCGSLPVLGVCLSGWKTRVSWVADFD
ncbi:hypothetical protein E1263_15320 [Kribbella antibiotica]|uniref:SCP domain-containing protein n=1 Tax=Kribbella antibiotica TaxID=190195 RepID=A0A4R4ZKU7_9ACTN|nr:hypothetical protein E1263_15320 [Kribbella antibiotica]